MIFADRIKQLRKEKGYTQASFAEAIGMSKGTVAMWETGKRTPDYGVLNQMSVMFDRRIDYILGYSDDETSPKISIMNRERAIEWETQSELIDVFRQYLSLDEYGKMNVDSLIRRESVRCHEQGTATSTDNIKIRINII